MNNPDWHLLLIDNDEDDYLLTRSLLNNARGRKISLDWAPSYEEGYQYLKSRNYHAVLVDYDLGTETGIMLIRDLSALDYPAPFILYTGRGSYEVDLEALQAGATMYLTKSEITPLLLERSIRYAIERKQIELELRAINERMSHHEEQYHILLNNMTEGFAVHEIITDEAGHPCDYLFLKINPAFERLTGLSGKKVLGKRLSEVLPGSDPYWVETYGQVALTGQPVRFVNYSTVLERWYDVYAFRTAPKQFGVIFTETTERMEVEQALHTRQAGFSGTIDGASTTSFDKFFNAEDIKSKGEVRQSGIEVIGSVPWGTHFCQFYGTSQDLIETLVPYFKAGLEANEFCMWITSQPLQVEEAEAVLRAAVPDLDDFISRGQIEILDYTEWYTLTGSFDADLVLQGWLDKLESAQQKGFAGLRLTGNTFWLEKADWDDFTRYEEKVNQVIGEKQMIAMCTYAIEKCGFHEILDVITNHEFALIKNDGKWEIITSAGHMKMEHALRESEERLRLAIWAAKLGVFEWDLIQDKGVWENQRMYEVFGQPIEENALSMSQFLQEAILPEDATAFEVAIQNAKESGQLFETICRIQRRSDGEQRWVEFSGRFERDSNGKISHLNGVVEDITIRKQAEKDLEEQNQRLKIYAEQLKRSNEALDEFAFIASHDLQEPLRKIRAFGDLLKNNNLVDHDGFDYLNRMQKAVQRMEEMLNGLLDFARVSTQSKPFSKIDLSEIAKEVVSDLEGRMLQSGGSVEIGELPLINADPLQMRQLLQNLVGNALKFRRVETPPLVKISSKSVSEKAVALIVEDNGIGFDPQRAKKLFIPFNRLHSKSEYEGSGLGLAICKKIVEHHGGSITVESKPGEGSRFTVVLPVENAG
ncbi:MAG: PAS domain S-box protein [Chloroflexi bacterium]|nr:MAG: PAS domain S-box protein [Chloroflexota bacterium]